MKPQNIDTMEGWLLHHQIKVRETFDCVERCNTNYEYGRKFFFCAFTWFQTENLDSCRGLAYLDMTASWPIHYAVKHVLKHFIVVAYWYVEGS